MTDIAAGNHAKLILKPGDVYRVSTGGVATVTPNYGAPAGDIVVTASTQDIGPYAAPAKLTLVATSGPASYRLLTAQSLVTDSSGATASPDSMAVLANSGVSLPRGARNWKRSNTQQIRAAMAGAQARDFRSRLIFIGDSSLAGTDASRNAGTGLPEGTTNARRKGGVSQLEEIGLSEGYQVNESWWMGDGGSTTSDLNLITAYDPRIVFGSDCNYTANFGGPGRGVPRMTVGPTNGKMTFTPRQTFDTIDVLFLTGASGVGSATVQNQSGAGAGSFNTQIGNGNAQYTATVPAGSTAAVVAMTAATQVYVNGFGTRDSTKPGIEIINCGISGIDLQFFNADPATGNNWNTWRAAASKLMTAATKNIVVLAAGYNDIAIYGRTLEQVKANMRVQIEFLKGLAAVPDIVWVSYPNLANPAMGITAFDQLQQAQMDLAVNEYDLPVIDQRETMESGAVLQALNMQAANGVHNIASGQAITARSLWNAFVASRQMVV